MEDNNSRRRQNEPPVPQYSSPNPRYASEQVQAQGRAYGSTPSDRYRPGPVSTPQHNPAARAALGATSAAYGYYPEAAPSYTTPIPTNTMQYQAEFAQDQRQQPGYTAYNPNLIYGVNQQAQQSTVYDAAQQFQTRQAAPMQMLSEVASPYYAGEASSASGAPVLQHQASGTPSNAYQPALQGYSGNINIAAMDAASGHNDESEAGSLDEAYTAYQDALKQIFYSIQDSRLVEASTSVLDVSDWLLSNVSRLGLNGDDANLHSDRIKLWNEFNNAWLTLLQRQKELTQEVIQTGIPLRPPQSMISQDQLWKMSKELVRLCDSVEKHGLVDYELGVWEENIVDILLECVDLLDSSSDDNEGPSNPGPRRGRP